MIQILQDWNEVGNAVMALDRRHLPLHFTTQKNWDHYLISQWLEKKPKDINIIDLGCGEGDTLRLLAALGFSNVYGMDLSIPIKLRLKQLISLFRKRTFRLPFHLRKGSIVHTPFSNEFFDLAISVSVIEHDVSLNSLFSEVFRMIKPGGQFFITTDYWEKEMDTSTVRVYRAPWRIFSREKIVQLIQTAKDNGFGLSSNDKIPLCGQKTVRWQNREYTFIAFLFTKIRHQPPL